MACAKAIRSPPSCFFWQLDGISRLIQEAKRQCSLKGIEVAQNFWVTHLLFVDDIILFSNGSLEDCRTLKRILDLFLKSTGLCINERKSTITCSGLAREEVHRVALVLNFEVKSLEDSFKYLGFYLKLENYRIKDWHWILANLELKLKHWSHKCLSRVGRLVLIKSVMMAIPVYWASLTWVPKGILNSIEKLCISFLWAGSKSERVTPWIAWEKIARPKEWGGWGPQIRLGRDPWIGCSEGFTLSQGLVKALKERGLYTLNQVADPHASTIWNQGWLQGRDLNLIDDKLEEWDRYTRDLLNSLVRLSDSPDELKWVFAQNGLYSPKVGYNWMMSQKGWENPDWWEKSLWKLKGPAKSKFFFWCVLLQKVSMWDFLQRRGRIGPGRCPLCKDNAKTVQHLFLFCPFNSSLWAEMLSMINIPYRWEGQGLLNAW
eukprot:PITA_11149